mgnify:FL=1
MSSFHDHLLVLFLLVSLQVADTLTHHLLLALHEGKVGKLANYSLQLEHGLGFEASCDVFSEGAFLVNLLKQSLLIDFALLPILSIILRLGST